MPFPSSPPFVQFLADETTQKIPVSHLYVIFESMVCSLPLAEDSNSMHKYIRREGAKSLFAAPDKTACGADPTQSRQMKQDMGQEGRPKVAISSHC
jgi:hypothetical protein